MSLRLLFLGTGTSAGVPMIGCHCDVCESDDPRDRRTRPSVAIEYDDGSADAPRRFIIDTTPDLRDQCIRHRIDRIDGVFYTHAHADHILGIDDLRRFNAVQGTPIDLYAERSVIESFRHMFPYIFDRASRSNESFIPNLIAAPIDPNAPRTFFGATWTPLRLMHGRLPILGFRVDLAGRSIAYCTDVSSIPPQTYPLLEDLDVLVLDALRYRHHPTHFTVDQALEQIGQIQPRRTYLTHIAHDISHADLDGRLPEGVQLGYDGLAVDATS